MQRSDLNLLSEAYNNINYNRQLLSECNYYWHNVPIEELFKSASDEVITELFGAVSNAWAGVKNAGQGVMQNYRTGRDNAMKTKESVNFNTKTLAAFSVELERVAKILGVANYKKLTLQQLEKAMTFPVPAAPAPAPAPAAPVPRQTAAAKAAAKAAAAAAAAAAAPVAAPAAAPVAAPVAAATA